MIAAIMLPDLRNQGFFADKNRAFWILQAGGWGAYLMLRALSGLANSMGVGFILPAVIVTATGFSLTLLMAAAYRRIIIMKPAYVWTLTLIILAAGSALFSVLEVWAHATFYEPGWKPQGIEFLGAILLDFSVLAAWTGLYYGINYYLLLSDQSERMLNVAAQANSAQLEMLRYQLNPHFLFNTLNSISTLVLLKETERANAMLGRLSSFLRYTLANEPTAHVTVQQEFETLKLYLEIEKMRFEERLRPTFDVDVRVAKARLPSLLLQPLVENAIKYAVTPQEDGAEIAVTARLTGDRVQIVVSDTGPGLNETKARQSVSPSQALSTGVGLANIRERLAQAYGPDHKFETRSIPGGGFGVEIEIPFQLEEPKKEFA